jgi:8-oxo-dGTP pyrophosphatase MutT (NUDIX family)
VTQSKFPPKSGMLSSIPDPRAIPSVRNPDGDAALASHALSPAALQRRFSLDLPWQPDVVQELQWQHIETWREAAVLIGLVLREEPTLLLTQRSAHVPTHAAQIAFPGGKVDASDHDARAAALREAHEEVGLPIENVRVLGEVGRYTTGSGFRITPVVALIEPPPVFRPNPGEVDAVFEVPLSFIMNPDNHHKHQLNMGDNGEIRRQWWSMPYHDPAQNVERYIWGATAGMLRNFYRFLSAESPLA